MEYPRKSSSIFWHRIKILTEISPFLPQRNFLARFKMTGPPFNRNVESTPRRQTLANKAARVIKKQKQLENYPQPATVTDYDSSRETFSPNCQRSYQRCTFFLVVLSYFFSFYRYQPKRKRRRRKQRREATITTTTTITRDASRWRAPAQKSGSLIGDRGLQLLFAWLTTRDRPHFSSSLSTFSSLFSPPDILVSPSRRMSSMRTASPLSLLLARSLVSPERFYFPPVPRTTKPSESNCVEPRSPLLVRSDYDDPSTTVSSSSFDLWITDNRIRSYSLHHEQSPPPPFDRPAEPVFYEHVSMIIVAKPCHRLVFTFFHLPWTTSKWKVVGEWTVVLEDCFHGEYHSTIAVNCQQYISVKFLKDELCLFKTKMVDFDAFMGNLQSC